MIEVSEKRVLTVGMFPPPYGGQALMIGWAAEFLSATFHNTIIDLQLQNNLGESGKLSLHKLTAFGRILWNARACIKGDQRYEILYYCPAGPSRIGIVKDLILLSFLRPHASRTIYHFHGTGTMALLNKMGWIFPWWAQRVLFHPDVSIRCADVSPNDSTGSKARRDVIISNGIPDPLGSADAPLPPRNDCLGFAFTGVLTEEKGIFDLVEIAKILGQHIDRFTFHLIGEGNNDEVSRFDERVQQCGLQAHIKRHGVLTGQAKFDVLKSCTLFLFPTFFRAETQPLAVIEAMAIGMPAVVSDWRGLRSIVDDGVNGAVLPARNPEAFAIRILEILNSGKLDEMRVAARASYLERFTQKRFTDKMGELFRELEISCDPLESSRDLQSLAEQHSI
jgi:glycosyltransferase involved in cell wall biosynthesis